MATSKCELKITIPSKASQKTLMEYSINSPIGERVRRKETQRFITGTGRYVDDLYRRGHCRSRSRAVPALTPRSNRSTSKRRARCPVCTLCLPARTSSSTSSLCASAAARCCGPVKLYPLAVDKVRYFGEPLAVVVADNRYLAEDAAEMISVDYDLLPVVIDPEAAMEPGAQPVHEDAGSNIVYKYHFATDGIDKVFQDADVVIKERIRSHRITACPIEPRAYLASTIKKKTA